MLDESRRHGDACGAEGRFERVGQLPERQLRVDSSQLSTLYIGEGGTCLTPGLNPFAQFGRDSVRAIHAGI
ncbi:MAG: hypothetical protein ACT4O1_04875 [Gemmatimonadota bacterium]